VSTDAGGVPAILTSEVHGLLAPCGDHDAVADRVCRVLEDPDLAERLALRAHESCSRYLWPAVRAQWLEVYSSLVHARGVPQQTTT
jgi:glycosyltransferase involved in cell wall biosynthesis